MKKIYLLLITCLLSFPGFSATWYSQAGAVTTLTNWNALAGGGGATPASFATAGDIWIVQSNMTIGAATWIIAGTLQMNSGRIQKSAAVGNSIINIGGKLNVANAATITALASATNGYVINLSGNLSFTGTSLINHLAGINNVINFVGAGTLASPQTVTWTSTGVSANTSLTVNAGTFVQLLSNVTAPTPATTGVTVNGALVCGTFAINGGGTVPVTVNAAASLYTANATGINGSLATMSAYTLSGAANYIFNGAVAQATGTRLPAAMLSGGSVTINNSAAAVTLSQTTSFASGATLNLENGAFTNTAANLVMNSGSNVQRDNGTMAVTPTTYSGVNLTYANLGNNQLALTTGNEWPASFSGNVTVNHTGATITLQNAKTLPVLAGFGNITLNSGILDASVGNYNISMSGTWGNNASAAAFTPRAASVIMNGTAAQTVGGTFGTIFNNLTVNNAAGVTLGNTENVNGTLTFTSGRLSIGANDLVLGTAAPAVAGALSSANMIVATGTGHVIKMMAVAGAYTFPVGDATPNYTPVTLSFTGGSFVGGAYAGVNLRNVKHPNNADLTDYINRYWSVVTFGITTPAYNASATYVAGDVAGTEANIAAGFYPLALPWLLYGPTTVATHTLTTGTITSVAGDISGIALALPTGTVSGGATICAGFSTTLSVTSATGVPTLTYSWAPATGLSATTGTTVVASPVTTTTYTLTITDGNGITGTVATLVSVNPTPAAISGPNLVCEGQTVSLSSATAAGTWTSTFPANGSVSTTGVVSGVLGGTTTISYTVAGCSTTLAMTVTPAPGTISGPTSVCVGNNIPLSNSGATGGVWSTTDVTASVIGSTGVVTGVSAGTATISYTTLACNPAIYVITVNAYPSPVSGATMVCEGSSITLSDAPAGGTWGSLAPANATVSPTGLVNGILAGTATITYDIAGCAAQSTITVNPLPAVITGATSVCIGNITFLSDVTPGGSWSSSSIAVATIGTGGDLSGLTAGTTTITYLIPSTGCFVTYGETVNALPSAITGSFSICLGSSNLLSDVPTGGTWTSSDVTVVTIGSSTGSATGITLGTAEITYTVGTSGCFAIQQVTVIPVPAGITGPTLLCTGASISLTDATAGGTWSSSAFWVASVGTVGDVSGLSGGTTTISYMLPDGCFVTYVENVVVAPSVIVGDTTLCVGYNTTLLDSVSGGIWSSGAAGSASVNPATGDVHGVAPGSVSISYTIAGCPAVAHNITVNAVPAVVTGGIHLCDGDTTNVYDLTVGGHWFSNDTTIATIVPSSPDSTHGIAVGVSLGVTTISYTMPTGCYAVQQVTVNPLAPPIAGTDTICATGLAWLTDIVGGGTWTSSNPAVASIDTFNGMLTGIVPGITYIVYTLPITGCTASLLVTSKPAIPAISGATHVCTGSSITLTDPYPGGGTWSSANTFVATIGSTGVLSALYPDTTTITFMVSAFQGCYSKSLITVNPLPNPIVTYNYAGHTASTYSFYTSYQWYNDRTGLMGGATTPGIPLPHPNDSVYVRVTDTNGCVNNSAWFYHDPTGVSNVYASEIRIYPNPASGTIYIDAPVKVRAVVTGVDGKMILAQADAKEMNISSLASGIYLITLYDEEGHALTVQKLMKE